MYKTNGNGNRRDTGLAFQFSEIYNALELFMNIYSSRFSKKKRARIKLGGYR